MDIIQWLNEYSDEGNIESDVDDEFNDPDFQIPDVRNVENFVEEHNQSSDEDSVEPVSEEEINDPSSNNQQNLSLDLSQLHWGPVTGNLNNFPYNSDNDFVGINPDMIDSMYRCEPYDFLVYS